MPKKKIQAIKADTGEYEGIVHDGKEHRFKRDGTFVIDDVGLAKELDSIYGKKGTQKLAFTDYDDNETIEHGHKYTFGALTGKARDNYDRIFRKKPTRGVKTRRKSAEAQDGVSG